MQEESCDLILWRIFCTALRVEFTTCRPIHYVNVDTSLRVL